MEFKISTDSIQRAVKVLGVVVRINAADATGRVLIDAKENVVTFMANNGETAISIDATNVTVVEPGTVAVTYSKIKSFVSSYKAWDEVTGVDTFRFVSDEKVTNISVDNFYTEGKSAKGELKLTNYNPALIVKPPKFEEVSFKLNSTIFRAASNKVLYAINPKLDFNQPSLQGMHIKFEDESIFFAGSDGVVLSEYEVKNVSGQAEDQITLQYDFIMGLRRLLSDDISLEWEIKGNRVAVRFDGTVFIGRRIVGHEFPNYKPALEDYTDHINLSKDFLMSSLYPFVDVLDPEDNFRLTFEIKDKVLKIFNTHACVESEQDITGGLDFSIDLNGKHMIQTIEAIKDDHVLFKFTDADNFVIFDSSHFEDQKALITSIKKR